MATVLLRIAMIGFSRGTGMPRSFAVRPALVIVLLTLCLGVVVAPAGAMIIISNYPFTNDSTGTNLFVGNANGGDSVPKSKAAGFTMPAGLSYTLDSVTLRLMNLIGSPTLQLDLFADSGGNPVGPSLVSFAIPPLPGGFSDVTFTPSAAFTFSPSTPYWLAAKGVGHSGLTEDTIGWRASLPGITPTGIAASDGYRFSSSGVDPPTDASDGILNTYQVDGTPLASEAPEPSSLTLFGLGALGLAGYRWRRRRATNTP